MTDKERIENWINDRFRIPNTFNRKLLYDFIVFLEKELGYIRQPDPEYDPQAELYGRLIERGWIPPGVEQSKPPLNTLEILHEFVVNRGANAETALESDAYFNILVKILELKERYPLPPQDKAEAVVAKLKAIWLAGNCIKEFRPDEVPMESLRDIAREILSLLSPK